MSESRILYLSIPTFLFEPKWLGSVPIKGETGKIIVSYVLFKGTKRVPKKKKRVVTRLHSKIHRLTGTGSLHS